MTRERNDGEWERGRVQYVVSWMMRRGAKWAKRRRESKTKQMNCRSGRGTTSERTRWTTDWTCIGGWEANERAKGKTNCEKRIAQKRKRKTKNEKKNPRRRIARALRWHLHTRTAFIPATFFHVVSCTLRSPHLHISHSSPLGLSRHPSSDRLPNFCVVRRRVFVASLSVSGGLFTSLVRGALVWVRVHVATSTLVVVERCTCAFV